MNKEKKTIEGPGFIMAEETPKEKITFFYKDIFVIISVAVIWSLWVVLYILCLRPYILAFCFNVLRLQWFPMAIHFILIFLLPAIPIILIYNIFRRLRNRYRRL